MKRLLIIILFMPYLSNAQKKDISFIDYLEISALQKGTIWNLHYSYNEGNKVIDAGEITSQIQSYIDSSDSRKLLLPYERQIRSQFESLRLIGTKSGSFIVEKSPFLIKKFSDGAMIYMLDGATSDVVYNTLKLDEKERAKKVISEYILPSLHSYREIKIPGLKYFGMSFTYASKDFSNSKDVLNLRQEYVFLLLPIDLVTKYVSAQITEIELLAKSKIYVKDRTMITGIKLIVL